MEAMELSISRLAGVFPALLLSGVIPSPEQSFAKDVTGSMPQTRGTDGVKELGESQLSKGHRYN